jgi:PTS system cellobiose-specific IIB component
MAVIDMRAYGMMDGEKVLRQALALIDEKASSK